MRRCLARALLDRPGEPEIVPSTHALIYRAIDDTIAAIRKLGKQVVLVSGPPREQGDMSICLERVATGKFMFGKRPDCTISRALSDKIHTDVNAFFEHAAASGTEIVWLRDALCDDRICKTEVDGVPIYRNRGHLSPSGSIYVAQMLHLGQHLDALISGGAATP